MSVIFKILTRGSSKPVHLIIIAFILICPGALVSNFGLGGDGHKLLVLIVNQFCYTYPVDIWPFILLRKEVAFFQGTSNFGHGVGL